MLGKELTNMKYYSQITKKLYDSVTDLTLAENKIKEAETKKLEAEKIKKAERATRAKEVEAALKASKEASAKANKLLKDFTNDYGYFHMSYSTDDAEKVTKKTDNFDFFDLLNSFLQ